MDPSSRDALVQLLEETAGAHHRAFAATGGEDADWAIWYADRLQQPLSAMLGVPMSRSRIVFCLIFVENERQARNPQPSWAEYYADHFLERFAAAKSPAGDRLALYHFPGCSYCTVVLRTIERLGLEVELRDIRRDQRHWDDLFAARGRGTVPVLRITGSDGADRWMPESRDIVEYLDRTYG
jgi:glutaredoxin